MSSKTSLAALLPPCSLLLAFCIWTRLCAGEAQQELLSTLLSKSGMCTGYRCQMLLNLLSEAAATRPQLPNPKSPPCLNAEQSVARKPDTSLTYTADNCSLCERHPLWQDDSERSFSWLRKSEPLLVLSVVGARK